MNIYSIIDGPPTPEPALPRKVAIVAQATGVVMVREGLDARTATVHLAQLAHRLGVQQSKLAGVIVDGCVSRATEPLSAAG